MNQAKSLMTEIVQNYVKQTEKKNVADNDARHRSFMNHSCLLSLSHILSNIYNIASI